MVASIKKTDFSDGSEMYSVVVTQDYDIVVMQCLDRPHAEQLLANVLKCTNCKGEQK